MFEGVFQLGERFVQAGLIAAAQLEAALAAQVQRGGRLGTILVEAGLVRVDHVSTALGEQHGVPVATREAFEAVSAAALAAVPRSLCEAYHVFPLAIEERTLYLAMRDPHLIELVDHLGTVLNMNVVHPLAVAELRLYYYLERCHRIPRPNRYLRDPAGVVTQDRRRYLSATVSPHPPRERRGSGPIQLWESWGQPTSSVVRGEERSGAKPSSQVTGPFPLPGAKPSSQVTGPFQLPGAKPSSQVTGPFPLPGAKPSSQVTGPFPLPPAAQAAPPAATPRAASPTDDFEIVVDAGDLDAVDRVPVTRILEALDEAPTREAVIAHLLRPTLPEASLAVLFLLRGSLATAEGAWGTDRSSDQVKGLVVAIEDSPLFKLALTDRCALESSADDDPLQRMIARQLGVRAPKEVCVAPIWCGDQPVNLLCVQTARGFGPAATEALDRLSERAGAAYLRLGKDAASGEREAPAPRRATTDVPAERRVPPPRALLLLPAAEREFGRYLLICRLASGGMANLYLARLAGPDGFEKLVAIKRIHEHLSHETDFITMFADEARLVARISHPNVVQVLELGFHKSSYFIAMEYVEGESLGALLGREGPPFAVCARIVANAAAGLHAAHQLRGRDGKLLGVVHRDVSPDNILVSYDGAVKVVDFGVAKARGNLYVTSIGTLKGKFSYMAPEQLKLDNIDCRADIFALGIVLHEITTRQHLFRAGSEQATMANVEKAPIPLPSRLVPGYPPALEAIVMRALERDPLARYQTAEAMQADLERYIVGTGNPVLSGAIADLMRRAFADRIEAKLALLRQLELGEAL
jgi:serine/threonine-protein kinase